MWVQSLGQEDPMEEGMTTHSSILAWRIPMDRGAWGWGEATVHRVTQDTTEMTEHTCMHMCSEVSITLLGTISLHPLMPPGNLGLSFSIYINTKANIHDNKLVNIKPNLKALLLAIY